MAALHYDQNQETQATTTDVLAISTRLATHQLPGITPLASAGHQIIVLRSTSGILAKQRCVFFKVLQPILPSDDNTIDPIAPRLHPTLPSFNIVVTAHRC